MANIKGYTTVKPKCSYTYSLETNEAIDEKSIVWKVATIVGKEKYEMPYPNEGKNLPITFYNENTCDLKVKMSVTYKTLSGTKGAASKDIVLSAAIVKQSNTTPTPTPPPTGAKSATVNKADSSKKEADEDEKEIALKIHVYFDGTFGNRDNIYRMEQAIENTIGEGKKPNIHKPDTITQYIKDEDIPLDSTGKKIKDEDFTIEMKYDIAKNKYKKILEDNSTAIRKKAGELSLFDKAIDTRFKGSNATKIAKVYSNFVEGLDPTSEIISYNQAYTNIPIIASLEKTKKEKSEEKEKEKIISVYIEGVGTRTGKTDDLIALATGSDEGEAGIPSKIKRAFEEIKNKAKPLKIKNAKITSVEVCVLGFSRGAATTRNFVGEKDKLVSTLKSINKGVTKKIVSYKFVGIFDTVCSVTDFDDSPKFRLDTVSGGPLDTYITSIQKNNVKDFKLAMKDNVEEVVHLVAADEHRLFFPLTTIQTTLDADRGFELTLPGCHCDMGGGDADIIGEEFSATVAKGKKNPLVEYLMDSGWHPRQAGKAINKEFDMPMTLTHGVYAGSTVYVKKQVEIERVYKFERKVVVGYNKIPLAIMLHFADTLGKIELKSKEDQESQTKVCSELDGLQKRFLDYAKANHKHGKDDAPVKIFNHEFAHLRHKYIHLSAVLDFIKDISRELSMKHIMEVKDLARYNKRGVPNRAILSDRSDWEETKALAKSVKNKVENVLEKIPEKDKQRAKNFIKKLLK